MSLLMVFHMCFWIEIKLLKKVHVLSLTYLIAAGYVDVGDEYGVIIFECYWLQSTKTNISWRKLSHQNFRNGAIIMSPTSLWLWYLWKMGSGKYFENFCQDYLGIKILLLFRHVKVWLSVHMFLWKERIKVRKDLTIKYRIVNYSIISVHLSDH